VVWCDVLIRLWLGPSYQDAAPVARIIALSVVPAFVFGAGGGLLDGATERPLNVLNLLRSYLLFVGFAVLVRFTYPTAEMLAFSYLAARLGLVIFTVHSAHQHLGVKVRDMRFVVPVSFSLVVAALGWIGKITAPPTAAVYISIFVLAVSVPAFVLVMARQDVFWARYAVARLGGR